MYAWEGIQSVLDDMELHLDEEIDLEEMAKKAGLSPFYFQKLFSRLVKKPFREYIKLRRLAHGCQMPLGEETGVDVPGEVWTRFHKEKVKFPRIPGGRELGLAYMGDAPEGSFTYFAGAEVVEGASLEGYEIQQLAPGRYLVCGFEAEDFMELVTVAINKAIKYSGRWMEEHGLTMDHYAPELYYDSSPEGSYMELWLPAVERTEDQESNPT